MSYHIHLNILNSARIRQSHVVVIIRILKSFPRNHTSKKKIWKSHEPAKIKFRIVFSHLKIVLHIHDFTKKKEALLEILRLTVK